MGVALLASRLMRSAGTTLKRVASRSRGRETHVPAVAGPLANAAVLRGSGRSALARNRLLPASGHCGRMVADPHQALVAVASWPRGRSRERLWGLALLSAVYGSHRLLHRNGLKPSTPDRGVTPDDGVGRGGPNCKVCGLSIDGLACVLLRGVSPLRM